MLNPIEYINIIINIYELNKLLINLPQYSPSQEKLQETVRRVDYPCNNQEKITFDKNEIDDF